MDIISQKTGTMGSAKFDIEKLMGKNDFSLWRLKMWMFLVHKSLEEALEGEANLPSMLSEKEKKDNLSKAHSALILSLGDRVLREILKEKSAAAIWSKLENLYMINSLATRLFLMPGKMLEDYIDDFNKIILDLENIEIKVDGEDQSLLLIRSLPSECENLLDTFICGRDSVTLEEVQPVMFLKELKKKS